MQFYKYDGAGNDFILVDIRESDPHLDTSRISHLCHRRFGIGADGLMTLDNAEGYDFRMTYYNSDGREGSMCGNGGRCIAAFATKLGLGHTDPTTGRHSLRFIAYDGEHTAEMLVWHKEENYGLVRLRMRDVEASTVRKVEEGWTLDTGSPHYVVRVDDLQHFDVVGVGRRLRNRSDLFPQGTNVDFIEDLPDGRLMVRTYERGVEDETYACGTGVTACAIVSGNRKLTTLGGDFKVEFNPTGDKYEEVWLTGPVSLNFEGMTL